MRAPDSVSPSEARAALAAYHNLALVGAGGRGGEWLRRLPSALRRRLALPEPGSAEEEEEKGGKKGLQARS